MNKEDQAPVELLPTSGDKESDIKHRSVVWNRHMVGMTQTQAYKVVYGCDDEKARKSGSRLFSRSDMQEYQDKLLKWINSNVVKITGFTKPKALQKLLRIADKAEKDGKYTAAIKAISTASTIAGYSSGDITINNEISNSQVNLAIDFFKSRNEKTPMPSIGISENKAIETSKKEDGKSLE